MIRRTDSAADWSAAASRRAGCRSTSRAFARSAPASSKARRRAAASTSSRDVAAWLPLIVIADLLGVDAADHARLLAWSEAMIQGNGATTPERLLQAGAAFDDYIAYQREVIADRRVHPRDDLVSILVHAEIEATRLSDNDLLMESLLILIGGDETTRHVLSGGMYELLRHPEQLQALVRDPSGIPTAVEEMLRWVSPIQNMARTAARAVELHGQRIEAGQKVLLLYPAANRDPAAFPDPHRFDAGARAQ